MRHTNPIILLLLGRIAANVGIDADEFATLTADVDEDVAEEVTATRTMPPSARLH